MISLISFPHDDISIRQSLINVNLEKPGCSRVIFTTLTLYKQKEIAMLVAYTYTWNTKQEV